MRFDRGLQWRHLHVSGALALKVGCCALLALVWARFEPQGATAGVTEFSVANALSLADTGVVDSAIAPAGLAGTAIEVLVRRNDTLDRIFRQLQLSLADLASLRSLPDLRTTLDRLRPGEVLTFFQDGAGQLLGLERQLSESERLTIARADDGFRSHITENPLERDVRTTGATITSSLFEAARAAGIADQTAIAIADVFAWDIDFVLDVRSGDYFVVTYEQLSQDGEHLRDGAVLAVKFVNQGREYRAVRYVDSQGDARFYTPEGRSLRKAFLRAPLEFTRVSSRFNPNRRHPVLNRIRAHRGVDYAAPIGTPVRAAGDGRVMFRGVKGGYGNVVELSHANGVLTVYGHMSRFARQLRTGQRITQGQVIGYVGQSGLATGPHLHYEYRVHGRYKDPQKVKLPNAEPLPDALLADFRVQTAPLLAGLDTQSSARTAPVLAVR
ncbi:MAG TPA: peptidoglycan DD-metalloendopeptidase family protein [Steroidobacteraceae bacterium]|nr:peptidoglycan DD-metalloendopeptidase family protein [Steroidobacteraceae bacterium]HQZ80634.1 peptidoglycan DD-metalloendopeptidase family protein [Steroidobacteraceae bacterium]